MTERVDCAYWVTIVMVWWYVALLLDGGFDGADGGADDGVSGGVSVEVGGFGLVRCWYQGGHLLEDQPRRWMSCRTGRQVTRHFTPVHSPFYISLFNIMKAAPVQTLPIWLLTQARSIHWPEDCLHLPRLLLSPHRALCRRGDEGSSRSESVSRLTDRPLQRILLIDYEIVHFWSESSQVTEAFYFQCVAYSAVSDDLGIKCPVFSDPSGPFHRRQIADFDVICTGTKNLHRYQEGNVVTMCVVPYRIPIESECISLVLCRTQWNWATM